MKKHFIFMWPAVFLAFFQQNSAAQNKAGSKNQITISIAGIEYDDPGFGLLKESLQKNKNASALKPGYNQGVATIALLYPGVATSLWEEVPKTTKDFFKLITIDDTHIVLTSKNTAAPQNNTALTSAPAAENKPGDDCKNCYWNMCNYDVVKSIGGKVYKGTITQFGTVYYNCDDGIVTQKTLTVNAYGSLVDRGTDTMLISSGPVGTRWGVQNSDGGGASSLLNAITGSDFSFQSSGAYTLIAKNIMTEAKGKTYKDAIVVNYRGFSKDPLTGSNAYNFNYYYAKGVGLIKTDTLNRSSNPISAVNKPADKHTVYSGGAAITNGMDATIIGTWMYHDNQKNTDDFYKFNADGSFDFYYTSVTEANRLKGLNHWKIEDAGYDEKGAAVLDLSWATGGSFVKRTVLEKKNDPATGKPAILLDGAMLVATDNRQPWK